MILQPFEGLHIIFQDEEDVEVLHSQSFKGLKDFKPFEGFHMKSFKVERLPSTLRRIVNAILQHEEDLVLTLFHWNFVLCYLLRTHD